MHNMTIQETIDAIGALAKVVEVNKGWLGNENLIREANVKIAELILLLPSK